MLKCLLGAYTWKHRERERRGRIRRWRSGARDDRFRRRAPRPRRRVDPPAVRGRDRRRFIFLPDVPHRRFLFLGGCRTFVWPVKGRASRSLRPTAPTPQTPRGLRRRPEKLLGWHHGESNLRTVYPSLASLAKTAYQASRTPHRRVTASRTARSDMAAPAAGSSFAVVCLFVVRLPRASRRHHREPLGLHQEEHLLREQVRPRAADVSELREVLAPRPQQLGDERECGVAGGGPTRDAEVVRVRPRGALERGAQRPELGGEPRVRRERSVAGGFDLAPSARRRRRRRRRRASPFVVAAVVARLIRTAPSGAPRGVAGSMRRSHGLRAAPLEQGGRVGTRRALGPRAMGPAAGHPPPPSPGDSESGETGAGLFCCPAWLTPWSILLILRALPSGAAR